jgi:hypothetical protein
MDDGNPGILNARLDQSGNRRKVCRQCVALSNVSGHLASNRGVTFLKRKIPETPWGFPRRKTETFKNRDIQLCSFVSASDPIENQGAQIGTVSCSTSDVKW